MNSIHDCRRSLAVSAVIGVAAITAAWASQRYLDMLPCAWCVLQRAQFAAIAGVGLLGALLPGVWLVRLAAWVNLLLSLSGIAAGLWLHFKASSSTSCALTLADKIVAGLGLDGRWPDLFAPMASCADAAVHLFGVPYVFYAIGLFVLCAYLSFTAWSHSK